MACGTDEERERVREGAMAICTHNITHHTQTHKMYAEISWKIQNASIQSFTLFSRSLGLSPENLPHHPYSFIHLARTHTHTLIYSFILVSQWQTRSNYTFGFLDDFRKTGISFSIGVCSLVYFFHRDENGREKERGGMGCIKNVRFYTIVLCAVPFFLSNFLDFLLSASASAPFRCIHPFDSHLSVHSLYTDVFKYSTSLLPSPLSYRNHIIHK